MRKKDGKNIRNCWTRNMSWWNSCLWNIRLIWMWKTGRCCARTGWWNWGDNTIIPNNIFRWMKKFWHSVHRIRSFFWRLWKKLPQRKKPEVWIQGLISIRKMRHRNISGLELITRALQTIMDGSPGLSEEVLILMKIRIFRKKCGEIRWQNCSTSWKSKGRPMHFWKEQKTEPMYCFWLILIILKVSMIISGIHSVIP